MSPASESLHPGQVVVRPSQQVGGAGHGGELHPGQVVLESDPRPPQQVDGAGPGGELQVKVRFD